MLAPLAALLFAPLVPQSPPAPPAALEQRIARVETGLHTGITIRGVPRWSLLERMEEHGVPGVSLAVIHEGRIAWTRTYGVLDPERAAPVEASTLFQAGSISKPVTAYAALKLADERGLALDADVNEFLRSWQVPENEFTRQQPVTLTQLLSHSAGLTVHGFPGYAPGTDVPTVVQVLNGEPPANTEPVFVDTLPGSGWRYSGGGYTVLQLLMTDVLERPFPELMQELALGPLGMRRSTFEQPLPAPRLAQAAAGVLPDGTPVPGERHTYPEMAAAGLWTTAEDLARFAVEVQRAVRGESETISAETARRLVEPVARDWSHGFQVDVRDADVYFAHDGWDEGFCAKLIAHRDAGYGMVVMINANQPAFMEEVLRAVAAEYEWGGFPFVTPQPMPEQALTAWPGRYRYNAEQALHVRRDGDRLFMRFVGAPEEELLYVGDERYVRRESDRMVGFGLERGETVFQFLLRSGRRRSHDPLADGEWLPREMLVDGSFEDAVLAYRYALESDPRDRDLSEDSLDDEARALLRQGQVREAVLLYRVNTELRPDSANAWSGLGNAQRAAGDTDAALRSFERALELEPDHPAARKAVGELRAVEQPSR